MRPPDSIRTLCILICPLLLFAAPARVEAQDVGQQIFSDRCAACHTIGDGRLIGPDLQNVSERRDQDWLIRFIQSSQSLVRSGDETAVAVFEEYGGMIMPDQPLSEAEVLAVLGYVASESGNDIEGMPAPPAEAERPEDEEPTATEEETRSLVATGEALFVGRTDFTGGATACNACHTASGGGSVTGGTFAADLTTAHSRLGEAGILAMVTNPPFPAMRTALGRTMPTQEEAQAIAAFLQANEQSAAASDAAGAGFLQRLSLTTKMLLIGFILFLALGAAAALIWSGRMKKAVNHSIYERQITST